MKRINYILGIALALGLNFSMALAGEHSSLMEKLAGKSKSRYTPEEKKLQEFWASYYKSLANYYSSLDNVDWVAYYKQQGYPIDPAFYNPYGMAPGTTLVPMSGMNVPAMVPPAKGGGVVQASYMTSSQSTGKTTEKPTAKTQAVPGKISSRR
jgi:hypothetical protein